MTIIPRRTHIKRLFGKSVDGDEHDVYVDVQRIDVILTDLLNNGQFSEYYLEWEESKDKGNVTRTTKTIELVDPTALDPTVWVPVDIVKELIIKEYSSESLGQETHVQFDNTVNNLARRVKRTRVFNQATNVDLELNSDSTLTIDNSPIVNDDGTFSPSDAYLKIPDSKDNYNYIDAEVCMNFATLTDVDPKTGAFNQEATNALANRYLIDTLDPIPRVNDDGSEPGTAVRLDPFQNIVNVNWGGMRDFYIVIEILGTSDVLTGPIPIDCVITFRDGFNGSIIFDKQTPPDPNYWRMIVLEVSFSASPPINPSDEVPVAFTAIFGACGIVWCTLYAKSGHVLNPTTKSPNAEPIVGCYPPTPGPWNDPRYGVRSEEAFIYMSPAGYDFENVHPTTVNFFLQTRQFIPLNAEEEAAKAAAIKAGSIFSPPARVTMPQLWADQWLVHSYRPKNYNKVGNFDEGHFAEEWYVREAMAFHSGPPPILQNGLGSIVTNSIPVPDKP